MTSLGYRSDHRCPATRGWCERTMQFYRAGERSFAQARAPPPGFDGVEELAAAKRGGKASGKLEPPQ